MELNAIDDGSGTVTSFNLVLSDSTLGRFYSFDNWLCLLTHLLIKINWLLLCLLEGHDLIDGENLVPLVFSPDFDINKLWRNGNGVQIVFIDSMQVVYQIYQEYFT